MDRDTADRLWAEVRALLRAPAAPDDPQLRRAARLLASSRSDAVELLLARWLIEAPAAAAVPATASAEAVAEDVARQAVGSGQGLRDAALLAAGAAAGVAGAVWLG